MKFLIDADVAIEVTRALRNARHEVDSVIELLGAEAEDADIWDHAARTGKL